MIELKACPCCGYNSPVLHPAKYTDFWIECPKCRLGTFKMSKVNAIKAWNTRVDDWQPIETAPKDGTQIIGYNSDDGASVMQWMEEQQDYYEGPVLVTWAGWVGEKAFPGTNLHGDKEGYGAHGQPTKWKSLPTPPGEE